MNLKLKFALLVIFLLVLPIHAIFNCCDPSGNCGCTATGTCSYACNANHYNCDGNSDNGCESATPCNHYTFQRFTFNLSNYNLNDIKNITYCFEGYYTASGSGTAKLQYYNVSSSSWVDDQNLDGSESVKCKTLTATTDVVNSSDSLFQFAARGYTGDSGQVTIYVDNVNLSVTYGSSSSPVIWDAGKSGYALLFNGSSSIQVANPSNLNITDQLTIEAWIKPYYTSPHIFQMIVVKGNVTGESVFNYALQLRKYEGLLSLYFSWKGAEDTDADETASGTVQAGVWQHVAVVFNYSANSVKLYVNGVEQAGNDPFPSFNLVPNDLPVTIGASNDGIINFNGTIDEVAIYSRAKSADEIAADANPLYVSLDMRDSLNTSVSVRGASSGYVNPGANNTFYLKMNDNGNLNITAGAYSGFYSFRAYMNNTRANFLIKTILEGVSSMQAVLPIQLQIYQQVFRNLIIAEK